VIRVWELATRLGLEPGEPGALVVVAADEPLGVVVEKVIGLREIADGALAPMAYWPDALGVLPDGDELVVVLDPVRLFHKSEDDLEGLTIGELRQRARDASIPGRSRMDRDALIASLRAMR
jgi:hypothetical protein